MSISKPPSKHSRAFLWLNYRCQLITRNIPLWIGETWAGYPRTSKPSIRICWPNLLLPHSLAQLSHPQPKKQKIKTKQGTGKGSSSSTVDGRPPKWGPNGPKQRPGTPPNFSGGIFGGAMAPSFSQEDAYGEITRLTHQLSQANPSAA